MIVEDDHPTRRLTRRMIASHFPDVVIYDAENGKVGVEKYQEFAPDIVLTNIKMPEMDGLEMAAEIKNSKVDTKFIVLTGCSDNACRNNFQSLGVEDYFLKPVIFKDVLAAIGRCIRKEPEAVA